ncbi:unnamed protein product [Nippostrongylus brasiliensis]|uniref:NADH dehydrogenase [ubiquinone] 1 alpha subcomplex subunit 1 n=1 Tax=Nippostrongylus brasiliensis TaxID=27835 RepID=A0A0N4XZC5_NIPBR|nr:unnamed protein product [Nippostrongylus brasiliensis]
MSLIRAGLLLRSVGRRWASSSSSWIESKIQLQKPSGETGHFSYGRNISRDPKAPSTAKPLQGDTPKTFMLRRLGHCYEVYPFIFLATAIITGMVATAYYSFSKIEVWIDRRQGQKAPWDWERTRDDYWKKSTVAFDLDGRTRKRCETMEILQDEMLEAAKRRGTR